MVKQLKFVIIATVGISAFTLLILFNYGVFSLSGISGDNNTNNKELDELEEEVSNIDLTVDYDNGSIKTKEDFTLDDGDTTVFDALEKWCKIEYDDYGESGYLITSIDGRAGDWLYEVNGDSPNIAANKYSLSNGDEIQWNFAG